MSNNSEWHEKYTTSEKTLSTIQIVAFCVFFVSVFLLVVKYLLIPLAYICGLAHVLIIPSAIIFIIVWGIRQILSKDILDEWFPFG